MCVKKVAAMISFLVFWSFFCVAGEELKLQEEKDKISYSVGHQIGTDFKRQGVILNNEILLRGIIDAMRGDDKLLMTEEEMRETLVALKRQIEADAQKAKEEEIIGNRLEGEIFLAENAKKEGVNVLSSGLQYIVLTKGDGDIPQENSMVEAHYRITLLDGTEIGNSTKKGKPAKFKVDSAIPGLKEALLMMKEGEKWRLFLPEDLAFGNKKNTPMAGQTIIYEIELLSVSL